MEDSTASRTIEYIIRLPHNVHSMCAVSEMALPIVLSYLTTLTELICRFEVTHDFRVHRQAFQSFALAARSERKVESLVGPVARMLQHLFG